MRKYHDAVAAGVKELPMFRTDVSTGIFAEQLVRYTLQEVFRFEYAQTKFASGELVQIDTGVAEGAKEYSYLELDHSGRAEIVADNATDIPYADISGRNNIRQIQTLAVGITYSTQDVRTAQLQGRFDIATEKAQSAREAMDRLIDDLMRTGDNAAGLEGFTNHSGINVVQAPTGTWATATSQQIVNDFNFAANASLIETDGVESPNTAIFPVEQWTRISTLPFDPAGGEATVLEYLKRAHPRISLWTWEYGLKEVGAGGTPAVMVYNRDRNKVRGIVPMLMRALPAEQDMLNFKLGFETRYGGIIAPKPRSIVRLDGV